MTRFWKWLLDRASRALAHDEREAVLGDLAERGDSGIRALWGVLDLVARRLVAPWKSWRPCLGLFGLALPLSLLLSLNFFAIDGSFGLYYWIARNHSTFDPGSLETTGLTLRHGIAQITAGSLLLVSWSWTSGYALGNLSRGALWVNRTVFCLMGPLLLLTAISLRRPNRYSVVEHGLLQEFSSAIPHLVFWVALVILPLSRGMWQSSRLGRNELRRRIPWSALALVLAPFNHPFGKLSGLASLLIAMGYWPVAYLVAVALLEEKPKHEDIAR